jgi:hypothetical protein
VNLTTQPNYSKGEQKEFYDNRHLLCPWEDLNLQLLKLSLVNLYHHNKMISLVIKEDMYKSLGLYVHIEHELVILESVVMTSQHSEGENFRLNTEINTLSTWKKKNNHLSILNVSQGGFELLVPQSMYKFKPHIPQVATTYIIYLRQLPAHPFICSPGF